ncbi:MAG: hypothetical protein U0521_15720 [Anaerolineae bacterium]
MLCSRGGGIIKPAVAQSDSRLEHLVLAGPPGPLSIPLAYLVVNDNLSGIADSVELVLWADQISCGRWSPGGRRIS